MKRMFLGAPLLACLFGTSADAGVMCLAFESTQPVSRESSACNPCAVQPSGSSAGGSGFPVIPFAVFGGGSGLGYTPFVPGESPLVPPVDGGNQPVVAPEPSSLAVMGCVAACVVVGCVRRRHRS